MDYISFSNQRGIHFHKKYFRHSGGQAGKEEFGSNANF